MSREGMKRFLPLLLLLPYFVVAGCGKKTKDSAREATEAAQPASKAPSPYRMNRSYENAARSWPDPGSVDWPLLSRELGSYLGGVVGHFSTVHPSEEVYGIVVRRGQNWEVEVYLNTRKGLEEGVEVFRKGSIGHESRTDEEIRTDLGLWYYDAWKYRNFELECPAGADDLNRVHLEVFGRLFDREAERHPNGPGEAGVSERFTLAVAEAIALLERSAELGALSKTDDFRVRFYDATVVEWETDEMMMKARANVSKRGGN